ncbi:MAG TPA: WYL domain-containing protein [Actinomyces sp.]|nr:WYL domain-containing protein [Actinomyces sp.]
MSGNVTRAERLLGLVMALSNRERGLTKEKIFKLVPGYDQGTEESIEKRFTRDKEELRDLGFKLETKLDPYLRETYILAEHKDALAPDLTSQERLLAQAAANLWSSSEEPEFHARLLATVSTDNGPEEGPQPPKSELSGTRAVATIARAISANKPVRFAYVKTNSTETETRTIEPWYLFLEAGNLYVRGFDLKRNDERVFRLSRVDADKKIEILDQEFSQPIPQDDRSGLDKITPTLAVKKERAALLRQHSSALENLENKLPDGWELLIGMPASFREWVDRVLAEIEDVVVLEPTAFRDFIDERIDALAGEGSNGEDN